MILFKTYTKKRKEGRKGRREGGFTISSAKISTLKPCDQSSIHKINDLPHKTLAEIYRHLTNIHVSTNLQGGKNINLKNNYEKSLL